MPVEIFTKADFENKALPKDKASGAALWTALGLREGEYAYLVPVKGVKDIGIEVRSSVHFGGTSAATGEDSIRCWIIDIPTGKPWGSKISRWTTRVPGWGERTLEVIRTLYSMAMKVTPCPHCSERLKVFKVKKDGPNKGKLFLSCPKEDCQWNKQRFEEKILGDEEGEVQTTVCKPVDPRHGATLPDPCARCGGVVKTFIAQKGKPENLGKCFKSCQKQGCGFFEWVKEEAPDARFGPSFTVEIPPDREDEFLMFVSSIGGRIC